MIQSNRSLVVILFLLVSFSALRANMASPNRYGLHPSLGIQSGDVDINSEDLSIILADSAQYAVYDVRYNITSDKEQDRFTLVFDCVMEFSDFEVFLDGTPIEVNKNDIDSLLVTNLNEAYTAFTINLDKGTHTIAVRYKGYPDSHKGSLLMNYTYKYNLAPVEGWKSFKNLNLSIDATALKEDVSIDIGDSTYQIGGMVKSWQFEKIPQKMLEIEFNPKGDLTYEVDPSWFFFGSFLLLSIINFLWLFPWRRKHTNMKVSIPAIVGALVIPAVALFLYLLSFDFIDDLIGQYASRSHGYVFLVVFTYPVLAIIYFGFIWAIDRSYKSMLESQDFSKKNFRKQFFQVLVIGLAVILGIGLVLGILSLIL